MKINLGSNYKFAQILILILLFLGSMNLGNMYFYFMFAAFFVCVFIEYRHLKIDRMFVVLVLFSMCYLIFDPGARTSSTTIIKQFVFPVCYLIGLNFLDADEGLPNGWTLAQHQLKAVIIILSLGAFVHYVLNMIHNFDSLSRNTVDVWTGKAMTATGQACLAIMATGVFCAWLFYQKRGLIKALAAIGLILIFSYNLILAGRTLIFVMTLVLVVALLFVLKTSQSKKKRNALLFVIIGVMAVLLVYTQNIFGVRDWVLKSNLSYRFAKMMLAEDTRLYLKYRYILNILRYPFGGGALYSHVGGYAHELYLDVYSDVGIVGYLLIVVFVVRTTINVWRVLNKNSRFDNELKLLVLCTYTAIFTEFFIEPIVQGVPWLLCSFCIISGLISRLYKAEKCIMG